MNSTPNPYAPPSAPLSDKIVEPENRATRGSRLGARLLDGLIVSVFIWTPLLAFGGWGSAQAMTGGGRVTALSFYSYVFHSSAFLPMTFAVLVLIGINLYLLHRSGQTMGKKLVGIRITRSDGSRAALSRIVFVRIFPFYLATLIPFVGFVVSLADPLFIFSESRKCLHDRLADTIVLNS
jgi:uncharacterized RDD family membrane protein YckC